MYPHRAFCFIAVAALGVAASTLQAQQQPAPAPSPAPPPSAPPAGGSIPSPGPTQPGRQPSPFPRPQEQSPFPQQGPRPLFFSGKVMMEDGTAPPEPVTIEMVCNGMPRPQAYTTSKGNFSFQLGANTGILPDASVNSTDGMGFPGGRGAGGMDPGGFGRGRGGMTEQQLMSCELRAALPGYRSDSVNLAGRRSLDNPDVGTIILRRMGNVEGTTISITSMQAPKDAKKAYEKGHEALRKKKTADAEKELQKAVTIYPKYAAAWYELGVAQEMQNRPEDARKSYNESLAADSKFIKPYLQLAAISARENKWQEVADSTDRAIKLDPFDFPQAYFYNSVAYYNLGKLEEAEKSAREARKLDTQHRFPKVNQLLGVILKDRRDYSGAAESMRDYLKFAPGAQDADRVRSQVAELEKLAGNAQPAPPPQQQ